MRKQSSSKKDNKPAVFVTNAHDDNGFLLSTSARPGGSKFQYVQKKNDIYRAVIPFQGKRHSFGPYSSEILAAEKVKQFFEQAQKGSAAMTRGQKRTEKFDHDLRSQIETLNQTAKLEQRHCLKIEILFNVSSVKHKCINTLPSSLLKDCAINYLTLLTAKVFILLELIPSVKRAKGLPLRKCEITTKLLWRIPSIS